jgi:hypothetical protein
MSDIEEFLKSYKKTKTNKAVNTDKNIEEVQQLLKPPIRDTKNDIPHIYNNITEEGYQQQADLLYLPTDAFGYKYCLVVVDVGTSKCDAQQLKHKTDIAVKNAFIKLYARKILEKPKL